LNVKVGDHIIPQVTRFHSTKWWRTRSNYKSSYSNWWLEWRI